jgi:hypothetical protein
LIFRPVAGINAAPMSFPHRPGARTLLLVFAFAAPLRAQIVSVTDFDAPVGHSYVIGIDGRTVPGGATTLLITNSEVYETPVASSGIPVYSKILVGSDWVENPDTTSSVVVDRTNNNLLLYTNLVGFAPATTSVLIPLPNTISVFPTASPSGSALGTLAMDSAGALYLFNGSAGVQKLAYNSYSSPLFTFGTSGAGLLTTQSYGLAVTSNVAYALDLANHRIARYDASNGNYLSAFAVTGDEANSRIAVSGSGRLYLTTGNGGGNIYDATTGATINTFAATTGTLDTSNTNGFGAGRDALFLDDTTGYLYTFDAATGMHIFNDPAAISAIPEPRRMRCCSGSRRWGWQPHEK